VKRLISTITKESVMARNLCAIVAAAFLLLSSKPANTPSYNPELYWSKMPAYFLSLKKDAENYFRANKGEGQEKYVVGMLKVEAMFCMDEAQVFLHEGNMAMAELNLEMYDQTQVLLSILTEKGMKGYFNALQERIAK
jgi:hypothetical protein